MTECAQLRSTSPALAEPIDTRLVMVGLLPEPSGIFHETA